MYLWAYEVAGPIYLHRTGEARSVDEAMSKIKKDIQRTYPGIPPNIAWYENPSPTETMYTVRRGDNYGGMAQISYIEPHEYSLLLNWPKRPVAEANPKRQKQHAKQNPFYQTIKTKDLPQVLKTALAAVEYGSRDIEIHTDTSFHLANFAGGEGRRAFTCIVNMKTGKYEVSYGDWGGAGLGYKMVDLDRTVRELPPEIAVINGSSGYGATRATLILNPAAVIQLLPTSETVVLSEKEKKALQAVGTLNSGGRKYEFEYRNLGVYGPENALVKSLESKGLLSISKSGQIRLTTEGENLRRSTHSL